MKKIYMIGNAHLDPVWLWRWTEGFQENKATFLSMLERLDEDDEVVFTSSSAQFYRWVEDNAPDLFARIKARIREGRWVLCGGMWIQPDCNLPSGESFARHALDAQNYFHDKFGVTARVGYNVDSFGHNGMLPQLLRLSGMDCYVFMRPGPHEKSLPGRCFLWESDDGSRVTAYRLPYSYCTFGDLSEHIDACVSTADPDIDELMCFYGVGNHGGGPTVENIACVRRYREEHPQAQVVFSDPQRFFDDLRAKGYSLPVVHGDLQHHASGCYSAQSEIKALNRRSEHQLLRAERWCSVAARLGKLPYPDDFGRAWERVLFNQFHDILAGSSIREAYEDARNEHGEALSIAARNENSAMQAIAFAIGIDKQEELQPVVVFNPHAFEVEETVEFESGRLPDGGAPRVLDCDGAEVPCQPAALHAQVEGRRRVAWTARVPALGYAVYRIGTARQPQEAAAGAETVLENAQIRVTFDPVSGGVRSICDRRTGTEYLAGTAAVPTVLRDESDTWSHGVFRFDEAEGVFAPQSIKRTESGPVRQSIRVISRYGASTMTQTFSLGASGTDLRVHVRLNWQERQKCLKLPFPLNLSDAAPTYSMPFGSMEKAADGMEEPVHEWMDLTGIRRGSKHVCGVSLISSAKYSASMERSVMSLTVLRSPIYAHHNPAKLTGEPEEYDVIDQGYQEFDYVIVPHGGGWREAGTVRKAAQLCEPCAVLPETFHPGELPQRMGFLHADNPDIEVTCLKRAEKTDETILRLVETAGRDGTVTMELPLWGKSVRAELGPREIRTYAVSAQADREPRRVDFREWNVEEE